MIQGDVSEMQQSRRAAESEPVVCGMCGGRGVLTFFPGAEVTCWNCEGTGEAPAYQTVGIGRCVHGVSFQEECEECEAETGAAVVVFAGEAASGRRFDG